MLRAVGLTHLDELVQKIVPDVRQLPHLSVFVQPFHKFRGELTGTVCIE